MSKEPGALQSLSEVITPISLPNGVASGATVSNSFMAPNSSASKCDPPIQRSFSTGNTLLIASKVIGNSLRNPVWKRIGSSSVIKYELNVNPPGMTSIGVQIR